MYYSLALITKGSVRTLVRSLKKSNGAEAWRLMHSRYAPDAHNRPRALMQKIMMLAKLWCDHAEGLEPWERASGTALADAVKHTVMMNMAPIFSGTTCSWVHTPTGPLFQQLCCNGVSLSRNLGANPTVSAGNGTGPDDDNKMQVDSLKKGKHPNQKGNRTSNTSNTSNSDINTCKNWQNWTLDERLLETRWRSLRQSSTGARTGRTGPWTKDCWRPGGGAYDNHQQVQELAELDLGRKTAGDQVEEPTTIINRCKNWQNWTLDERLLRSLRQSHTSNNSHTDKGKNHKKSKCKGKHVDVVESNQSSETASTVSYPSQTPSTIGALSCNPDVEQKGWIMGVTINSVSSTRRQVGADTVLLDSGAQLHACPIKYPGQKKYRCLILESTQQVELDSNMTEDGW